ncbi:MAG: Ig-like domain-containing protein [Desulfobacterales bacterium]
MKPLKETCLSRRQFIKFGMLGLSAVTVGSATTFSLFSGTKAHAQGAIHLGMTTADVEMVDGIMVPHWVYTVGGSPTLPGPVIFAFEDEAIEINITNDIPDGPRRFAIVGNDFNGNANALVLQTGDIAYGDTGSLTIPARSLEPGTYLYKDPSLDPISRVLGLHGVLVILPDPLATNPYGDSSTASVTALFDALGEGVPRHPDAIFPGQPWFATTDANPHGYDPDHNDSDHHHRIHFVEDPNGPQSSVFERFLYRTRIMLHSSIDPVLNRAVINDGNIPDPSTVKDHFLPQYFSINGRQGGFAMHSPDVIPMGTVGEPHVVRLLNAGLAYHSPHLHGNHFYVTSVNNVVGGGGVYYGNEEGADNIFLLDTVSLGPEDRVDWVVPFIRPPDIPRVVGDDGLLVPLAQLIPEELDTVLLVPQNPLSYPMHSHMELDQTAAGGNYPQGAIGGWEITGEFGEDFIPHSHPVPVAVDDAVATTGTNPALIDVLANDRFDGQPIDPAAATVTRLTNAGNGNALLNGDMTFIYTANAGFSGEDSFSYRVTVDGHDSNTAVVTIMVNAPEPEPEPELSIHQFKATNQVRLSRDQSVSIELRVRNVGTVFEGAAPATVVGMQNGIEVYRQTLQVGHGRKGGNSSFTFPEFAPAVLGEITWTVSLQGATATATTRVRQ